MRLPVSLRDRLWVPNAAEWLAFLFLLLFLALAAGALFSCRPGGGAAFGFAFLYFLLWIGWMAWVLGSTPSSYGPRGVLRALAPWGALVLAYDLMRVLVPAVRSSVYDDALRGLDRQVWGEGASTWGRLLFAHPNWTDFFCLLYLSLFVWLGGLVGYHVFLRRALYSRFLLGLMVVHLGGYLGYLLYPAVGPRFAYPSEWEWLAGGAVFTFTNRVVDLFGAKLDVFPSLHGALSAYLMLWQWRQDRWGLLWGLPLGLGIWTSTLVLGYHYLPDLAGGLLLALVAVWLAPRIEVLADLYRKAFRPPVVWLPDLVEGRGAAYGRLMERTADWLPLGGEPPPGFVFTESSRRRGEEPLRRALSQLGEGPWWVRPSEKVPGRRQILVSLRPLSREQAVRAALSGPKGRCFLVQKALKASAVGLCRSFPPAGKSLPDVEFRVTPLPAGAPRLLRVRGKGLLDNPLHYLFKELPHTSPFQLFELSTLTRRLAARWRAFVEVEWIASGGRVYVLDGRKVRQNPLGEK